MIKYATIGLSLLTLTLVGCGSTPPAKPTPLAVKPAGVKAKAAPTLTQPLTQQQADEISAWIQSQVTPVVPPDPPDPNVTTVGPGTIVFEELHVHDGKTLVILPGTELVRQDIAPQNPAHADGGIVVHGTIRAVRKSTDPPIIVRSENPSGHRGHLMIHGNAELDGVEFRDWGRSKVEKFSATNPIARYPVHFHLCGDRPNSYVKNCVIHDTVSPSQWRHGIVVHGTHRVTVTGNHIHHKAGAGIYFEDGTETDNLCENNLIEDMIGSNGDYTEVPERASVRGYNTEDHGFEGSGVWSRGPRNRIKNNTFRRCPIGMLYYQQQSGILDPILENAGNLSEQCHDGAQLWYVGWGGTLESTVSGFTMRNCKRATFNYPCEKVTWLNPVVENCQAGIGFGDYPQRGVSVKNPTISGCTAQGMKMPQGGSFLLEGGTFSNNAQDILLDSITSSGGGDSCEARTVVIRGAKLNSAKKVTRRLLSGGNNYIISDKCFVEDWLGQAGTAFRIYMNEQAADFILPATGGNRIGCPVPGLTNQQALAQHGVCMCGEIMPADATTMVGIAGAKVK